MKRRFTLPFYSSPPGSSSSIMGDLFGKQLRKQTARAKEKLLEQLGKAKATQDDVFDQHAANLIKQSKACERLNRDLKAFGVALKAMVQAQKTLRETIRDLYEPEWPDREHLCAITQSLDLQWDEFEKIVNEQMMGSANAYMAQFADLKAKVAKRGRKLVDFDSARNNYATVRAASKKGEEDPKVAKAAADLQLAETMYKDINKELVDALPATYDSRITFFVDTLQTIFNAESANHNECAKYNKMLVTQLDSLGNSFDSLRVPRPDSMEPPVTHSASDEAATLATASAVVPTPSPRRPSPPVISSSSHPSTPADNNLNQVQEEKIENKLYPALNASPSQAKDKEKEKKEVEKEKSNGKDAEKNPFEEEKAEKTSLNPFDESDEEKGEAPPVAKARNDDKLPEKTDTGDERKVLYKVRATHRYTAEDTDELTFDAGEVIKVLESNDDDQLDDGWLLGVKGSDGVRGVFPANFTKQI